MLLFASSLRCSASFLSFEAFIVLVHNLHRLFTFFFVFFSCVSHSCSQAIELFLPVNFVQTFFALGDKNRTESPKQPMSNPHILGSVNSNNKTVESINDKKVALKHEVTTKINRCNVCPSDVKLETIIPCTDESMNDERIISTDKITKNISARNVCPSDV